MVKAKAKKKARAPKSASNSEDWQKVREKVRVGDLLERVVQDIERQIKGKTLKATTAEYLKLIQLQKEFDQDEAKEIRVTWINPGEKQDDEEPESETSE